MEPDNRDGHENFYDCCNVNFEGEDIFVEIEGRKYKIEDYLDYGTIQVSLFKDENKLVVFLGLIDYYGSVYFVYYYDRDNLRRLGALSVDQGKDVEETGFKDITFRVYKTEDNLKVNSYLGGDEYSTTLLSMAVLSDD